MVSTFELLQVLSKCTVQSKDKTIESAEKAALYADMRAERRMRKHRNPSSYDLDMEIADCYYGYNQADFY